MGVDLYIAPISPNCRSVLMAMKAGQIDEVNIKHVDIPKGEHKTPEYLKMNPMHSVPTLDDNGFCLWESRPVMTYLVDKYGKVESIYPKDPQKRAVVQRWLYYDLGTIGVPVTAYVVEILFKKQQPTEEQVKLLKDALTQFDSLIGNTKYLAGDQVTIADFALNSPLMMLDVLGWDFSSCPKVKKWLDAVNDLSYVQEVNAPLNELKKQFAK